MAVGGECVRWRRESSCGETLGGVSSERQSVGCRDVFRDAWATRSDKRDGGVGIRWQEGGAGANRGGSRPLGMGRAQMFPLFLYAIFR